MPTLSLDDAALHYATAGDGPPLVFVHGGWMDGHAWRPQVDRFADDYRVVTLDVRGHGRTGATDRRRYSVELFSEDVEQLLAHLEIERPTIVGLSLGSMVLQEYLDRHSERVQAAVLAGPVRSMPPLELPGCTKRLLSPGPALATTLSIAGQQATFRSMLASIRATTGRPWLAVDPSVREAAIEGVADVSRREYRKVFDALYRFDPPTLDGLDTPTLTIYGDHEAPLVKRQAEEITAAADGECVEVPDAGHLVNLDRSAAFNRVLETYLDRVAAS